jgi:hypothetical protein
MKLNKEKAIHNYDPNNNNMKQARYLVTIMNEYLLSPDKMNPSQWDGIMLKDEKCDIVFNQVWTDYLELCHNLIYLTLDSTNYINLYLSLTNLEGLFLGCRAYIRPPSSMKIFVSYTSKEKYQEHKTQLPPSKWFLRLDVPEYLSGIPKSCTELKLW